MYVQLGGCCCTTALCNGNEYSVPSAITITFSGLNDECCIPESAYGAICFNASDCASCSTTYEFPKWGVEDGRGYSLDFVEATSVVPTCQLKYQLGGTSGLLIREIRDVYGVSQPSGTDDCDEYGRFVLVDSVTCAVVEFAGICNYNVTCDVWLQLIMLISLQEVAGATVFSVQARTVYVVNFTDGELVGGGGSEFCPPGYTGIVVLDTGTEWASDLFGVVDACVAAESPAVSPCPGGPSAGTATQTLSGKTAAFTANWVDDFNYLGTDCCHTGSGVTVTLG